MLIAGIAAGAVGKNALSADVDVEQAAVAPQEATQAPVVVLGGITEESIAHQCRSAGRRERARTRNDSVGSGPCRIVGWRERGRICRGGARAVHLVVPGAAHAARTTNAADTADAAHAADTANSYRSADAAYTAHSADATNPANTTDAAGTSGILCRRRPEPGQHDVVGRQAETRDQDQDGAVEFTDDDSDVKSLSPGGYLKIREGGWTSTHTVEFEADGSGTIRRRYWEGSSEKPFDPQGKAWLSQILPRIIRQTAIGAPARVARILKAKGAAGVLSEITLIEGSAGRSACISPSSSKSRWIRLRCDRPSTRPAARSTLTTSWRAC